MCVYCGHTAQLAFLLAVPRVRFVFSVSLEDVWLESGGPPGQVSGASHWRAVTRVLRSWTKAAGGAAADCANVFFPSDCRICDGPITVLGRVQVCEACLEGTPIHSATLCERCGDDLGAESFRFAASMGVRTCSTCRMASPEFAGAVAFGCYDEKLRELLHLLKFEGERELARALLGGWLAEAVRKLESRAAAELVVVPVPLFAARERKRGFNQAALLAREALARLRKTHPAWKLSLQPHALERVKNTRALFALDPGQRRRSLRGAFRVRDEAAVRGREVLLVDDIMTTGATARECSRVLLHAGATRVWVATVAKAQPERAERARVGVADGETSEVARWDATSTATMRETNLNT